MRTDRKIQPKLRIDVRFNIGMASKPAPNAHYETGAVYKNILADYQKRVKNEFLISSWASSYTDIFDSDASEPKLKVFIPKTQQLVKPGQSGKLIFYIVGARPTKDQLRVSLGQMCSC